MSLSALKDLDSTEASRALAAAALMTSFDPGVSSDEFDVQKYTESAGAILSELRAKLKLTENDDSATARTKLGTALSNEIYRTVLSSKEDDVLKRVGQAGLLPNSAYNVQQPESFANLFHRLGVNRQRVAEAIKQADETQHLLPEGATVENREDISLFLKRRGDHWLMVQTIRQGINLTANSAWLIFPAIVNLSNASQPIDVLCSFVEAFGVPFKMNGHEHRFIESVSAGQETKFEFPKGDYFFSVTFRLKEGMTQQVGAVYCIDLKKYKAFIVTKGISIRR